MRTLVVYESMFGNTREVAEAIAQGLAPGVEAVAVPVAEATAERLAEVDLLVVGGPTHAHSMSSEQSRKGAPQYVERSDGDLHLEPGYEGPGLRDWFHDLPAAPVRAAAFDTRADVAPLLSGRASKGIASRLRKHGCRSSCRRRASSSTSRTTCCPASTSAPSPGAPASLAAARIS